MMINRRPLRKDVVELLKPEELLAFPRHYGQPVMIPISPSQPGGPCREEECCGPGAQPLL